MLSVFLAGCGNGGGLTNASNPGGITITEHDFFFDYSNLDVTAGPAVARLMNAGSVAHTFTIPELKVDLELKPGESTVIDLEGRPTGDYMWFCRFHQDRGMKGSLTIREKRDQ